MKSILCSLVVCAAIAACEPYTEADFRAECEAVKDARYDYECDGYYEWEEIAEVSYSCGLSAEHYAENQAAYESISNLNDCLLDYWETNQDCGWDRCYWGK